MPNGRAIQRGVIWLAPSAFYPSVGGVEELTLRMAHHLRGRGWRVLVIVHQLKSDARPFSQIAGVEIERVYYPNPGKSPLRNLDFIQNLPRLTRHFDNLPKPDLVHVICPSNQTFPLSRWAVRRGVRLILTTQGETVMDANRSYERDPYLRASLRYAAKHASALSACSDYARVAAAAVASEFAAAALIPNGIEPGELDDVGPLPDAPVVAAWGRHVPQKGFDLLLRSFESVRKQRRDAILLLGGDGTETLKLKSLAGEGVTFLGPLDRSGVRGLLSKARTVAVPSRIEPFGIVALEALSAGRLLVYANTTGLPEAAGRCGWGVDPENTDQLASALLESFAADATDRVAMGLRRARQLGWPALLDRYEELYDRTAADSQ